MEVELIRTRVWYDPLGTSEGDHVIAEEDDVDLIMSYVHKDRCYLRKAIAIPTEGMVWKEIKELREILDDLGVEWEDQTEYLGAVYILL